MGQTKKAAIIGGGVIGGGWAARFLLNGWDVSMFDLDSDAMRKIGDVLDNARLSLPLLADAPMPQEGKLLSADTLKQAVAGAHWIQESVPERLDIKHKVLGDIQTKCAPEAIIGSSTSGFKPSELRAGLAHPEQVIVAHPYNPVYLLPVVELVGGDGEGSKGAVHKAAALLQDIGMKPVSLKREIDAHIGDRLLEAVWREALWLIKDGVATTQEIDDIITHGFGLRWAQMGLFETYRVAGGEAGMRHFISQFGPALSWPWTKLMDVPDLDDALIDKIASQSDAQSGTYSVRELERIRDRNLVGFLAVLKQHHWGAGKSFVDWTNNLRKTAHKIARDTDEGPLACYETDVLPAWIDYNGHMTEYRYLQVMSEATDVLLSRAGLDADYLANGHSFFTVETHIRHLDEAKLGDRLTVSLQILRVDAKKLHIFHTLTQQDGVIVATGEQMCLHVNLQSSRAVPMLSPVAEAFAELAATQQSLGMPEGAGRSIGSQK